MNNFKKIVSVVGGLYCLISFKSGIQSMFYQYRNDIQYYGEYRSFNSDLFELVFSALIPALILAIFIWKTRCPSCKQFYALKKVGNEIVHREDISVLTKVNNYDNQGNRLGTQEQYIPGVRDTYRITYKCIFCGEKKYKTKTKDSAKI